MQSSKPDVFTNSSNPPLYFGERCIYFTIVVDLFSYLFIYIYIFFFRGMHRASASSTHIYPNRNVEQDDIDAWEETEIQQAEEERVADAAAVAATEAADEAAVEAAHDLADATPEPATTQAPWKLPQQAPCSKQRPKQVPCSKKMPATKTPQQPAHAPPQRDDGVVWEGNLVVNPFTIGWEACGATYRPAFSDLISTGGVRCVEKRAQTQSTALKDQEYFLWLDCREINDPGTVPGHCGHIGEHVGILRELVAAPGLPDILQEVKCWVGQKADECGNSMCNVGLGYVCKSGTHRSVGINRIVSECLCRDGYIVNEANHLSKGLWKRRNRCYWCKNCKLGNSAKASVFDKAYAIWSQL